jgi:hypothetical protein
MITAYNSTKRYLYIPFIFLFVFFLIVYLYIQRAAALDDKFFENHAHIVADDIWALNKSGATAYLQLALKVNHYKSLSVSMPGASSFISVTNAPLTDLSLFLYNLKLIGLRNISKEIIYEGQNIGILNGEKYVRVIFPLFNILIFLLLISLTALFIIHLFINRFWIEPETCWKVKDDFTILSTCFRKWF